jgi:hypothetical protein
VPFGIYGPIFVLPEPPKVGRPYRDRRKQRRRRSGK